ncbi:CE1759 family FMN reductase [Pseudactinotalea suaedae]|jgi:FMN reductase|uniref:CE1759 family FMN reductase n=1 Tax=Pseudactinotalea suaedae TaxID=1524924 RepID=UPI0012E31941|nr:CE1759 family FMN reductase [Pseudactinotalea suaedae]
MRIAIIAAGLSEPSSTRLLADRLEKATRTALQNQGTAVESTTIEVRTLAHDVVDVLLTRVASPELEAARQQVQDADALIVVSPTFTMSYSGLFKSFIDVLEDGSLAGMPVLLAATGGTARHSMVLDVALRPLLSYLKALTLPTAVYASAEDWGSPGLDARIEKAGRELADVLVALPRRTRSDPFDADSPDFVSFESMLGGS